MRLRSSFGARLAAGLAGLAVLAGAVFLILTSPWTWALLNPVPEPPGLEGADLDDGRTIFVAGDCATCHASPEDGAVEILADGEAVAPEDREPLRLGGGRTLETRFGTFSMPNISPHPEDGIGAWSAAEFSRAVRHGMAPDGLLPDGRNLYPSHPYMAYRRMSAEDARDLFAFIRTLPPVEGEAPPHDLPFPFDLRRGVGLWRLAFLDADPPAEPASPETAEALGVTPELLARGRHLVEGPAHCAECHSPRTALGTIPDDMRFAGGPGPDGEGWFPNITPHETGIGFWSVAAIANYLRTGVSPVDISASGEMAAVVHNTAQLSDRDRRAMAAYMKTVPPVSHLEPGMPEPNRTPEVRMLDAPVGRPVELPEDRPEIVAEAETVHVSRTQPFHLSAEALASDASPAGKLLPSAALTVLEARPEGLRVRLEGWRMAGADRALHALKGRRIHEAVLGPEAAEAAETGEPVAVATTDRDWAPARLEVWIDGRGLTAEREALWRVAGRIYEGACGACHTLYDEDAYRANQWIGNLDAMKRYTALTEDQYRLVLAYLQHHARDVDGAEGGGDGRDG